MAVTRKMVYTPGGTVVTDAGKLKIQTTGPGAKTLLDEGPPAGKTWSVEVSLSVVEQDA